jgi:hypothetical protein
MKEIVILGIHVTDRLKDATKVQELLTKFGCSIKTRLGLHEVTEEYCSTTGLIILELTGDPAEYAKLENELSAIRGIEVKKMIFNQ